jgi:hypothetical protein
MASADVIGEMTGSHRSKPSSKRPNRPPASSNPGTIYSKPLDTKNPNSGMGTSFADVPTLLTSPTANPMHWPLIGALRRHSPTTSASDPGQTLRDLNEPILRQEPLDAKKSAKTTAAGTITVLDQRTMVSGQKAVGYIDEASGRSYPLQAAATRIGRLSDNDIVLDSANVSRHHAVIVDTGTSYILNDLRSSNGVHVQHQRIRSAATLHDGDHIRICDHEFTFRIAADAGDGD